jgi:TatD DNase family protein
MIDSHFHSEEIILKDNQLESLILEAFEQKQLTYGLDIGIQLDDLEQRLHRFNHLPQVGLSIGLYPSHANNYEEALMKLYSILEKNSQDQRKRVWAIGECGLDFHWNYGTPELQKSLLIAQIHLANQFRLPMIIHNRIATKQLIQIFKEQKPQHSGIIHCFEGTYTEAKEFLDLDFYISFSGIVTFKKNHELRQVLKQIPIERILFETDSPYLSPEPKRGRINLPGNVRYVYDLAQDLLNTSAEVLIPRITQNFVQLFPYCKG